MLIRRVIHYEVKDDVDVSLLCLTRQEIEVRQRPVHGIDILVIGNVVTEIYLWRREARRNPDRIYAKVFQVIQLRGDTPEIANSIVVTVGEAARINLVKDRVLPPRTAFPRSQCQKTSARKLAAMECKKEPIAQPIVGFSSYAEPPSKIQRRFLRRSKRVSEIRCTQSSPGGSPFLHAIPKIIFRADDYALSRVNSLSLQSRSSLNIRIRGEF